MHSINCAYSSDQSASLLLLVNLDQSEQSLQFYLYSLTNKLTAGNHSKQNSNKIRKFSEGSRKIRTKKKRNEEFLKN